MREFRRKFVVIRIDWLATLTFVVMILLACERPKKPLANYLRVSGDITPFLRSNIVKYAYRIDSNISTKSLPAITAKWAYLDDNDGTQILTPSDRLPYIYKVLTNLIGAPASSSEYSSNGFFSVSKNGLALQFSTWGTNLHLIFLKPKPR
jgi:hypothetical protein